MKKKIAVFTGNRAEYGLQYPILKAIKNSKTLEYRLVVSGAHLDEYFGSTLEEIQADGFEIHEQVKINSPKETGGNYTAFSIGEAIIKLARIFDEMRPDVVLVYADRFEGFAAVIAATQLNIATAHVEGGDLTEGGALDDSVRHAMTKLSHIHFSTNEQATRRILAMGEEPWRVHTVGLPAIDMIKSNMIASAAELKEKYLVDTSHPILLFTQHSVTTEFQDARSHISTSLSAIKQLAAKGVQCFLTFPNNDIGGHDIADELLKLKRENLTRIHIHKSLGRYYYHGFLALARDSEIRIVCAGNSSSGIKETPSFNCPSVNIGSRQKGRLRGGNVIDVNYSEREIIDAVERGLYDENFRVSCRSVESPYWAGGAGKKITQVLAELKIDNALIQKRMML